MDVPGVTEFIALLTKLATYISTTQRSYSRRKLENKIFHMSYDTLEHYPQLVSGRVIVTQVG